MDKLANKNLDKREIIQTLKEHVSKLPIEFVVGAVLGGGLFLLSNKKSKSKSKSVRAVTTLAKTLAPIVIIAMLEKFSDSSAEAEEKL